MIERAQIVGQFPTRTAVYDDPVLAKALATACEWLGGDAPDPEAAFAISMLLIAVAFAVILALRGRFLR